MKRIVKRKMISTALITAVTLATSSVIANEFDEVEGRLSGVIGVETCDVAFSTDHIDFGAISYAHVSNVYNQASGTLGRFQDSVLHNSKVAQAAPITLTFTCPGPDSRVFTDFRDTLPAGVGTLQDNKVFGDNTTIGFLMRDEANDAVGVVTLHSQAGVLSQQTDSTIHYMPNRRKIVPINRRYGQLGQYLEFLGSPESSYTHVVELTPSLYVNPAQLDASEETQLSGSVEFRVYF